jgi:membrane carboxypeptidase/penicillin-binding protein
MDPILVKIFATAFTLSEILTHPASVKTHLDPIADQDEVVQVLQEGCAHMRRAFDIETINLDELIATALEDSSAFGANAKAFHGINFADLNTAYHRFCKNEKVARPVDLAEVIEFYNAAAVDLPDPTILKLRKLPSMSTVLDGSGHNFADIFEPRNRRIWVPLSEIPELLQKATIAAEDRRFLDHHGVDERGIIRAFLGNLAASGRPQGGSSITQQVVKNLLVGEDVSYERKIREMIVASRLEAVLSKDEILELYLNSAYLGRGSWGVEMAARSYFDKPAKELTLTEAAMLAGLLKGPSYFDPERHPERAKERLAYVLGRMQEDGVIDARQKERALADTPKVVAFARGHRDSGFQFIDFLTREARSDGIGSLTAESYTVHATINAELQRDTEAALQEGLAQYEISAGRATWRGPEANIAQAVRELADKGSAAAPAWQLALKTAHLPLYDVHWTPAVILQKTPSIRVGLADGRTGPLAGVTGEVARNVNLYDVVYAHVNGSKAASGKGSDTGKSSIQAHLRVRPLVQGAALVLENRTGRILAMAGSFSYPLSQLNRTWQTERQPGSTIKPVTYLTALQKGLQPNTLIRDEPLTLPPIGGARRDTPQEYFWTPRNADHGSLGTLTLRRGLEYSRNLVTAHLLDGGIESDAAKSLDDVCATATALKIYSHCVRYYPFVLGAQPVRMIDLAAFYAAVAQEGVRPQPHAIDSIEANGHTIYRYPDPQNSASVDAADRASFYQLKSILQGVVARGTARAIAPLSPYVAGKTGTTEDAVDGWFIGFTNDVTVAVWVGYDNADRKRRSLGSSETGASVALPIFEPIMEAIWARKIAPKEPLSSPTPEAQRKLVDEAIDYQSGERVRGKGFIEHFRLGPDNKFHDTQYLVLSGRGSDDQRGAKVKATRSGGEASKRATARAYADQAARQARDYWQGRAYYDSWQQPFGRGQDSNYRW